MLITCQGRRKIKADWMKIRFFCSLTIHIEKKITIEISNVSPREQMENVCLLQIFLKKTKNSNLTEEISTMSHTVLRFAN